MNNIDEWNDNLQIQSNDEINVQAVEGDFVWNIGGYLFLIQRKDDFNNIVFSAVNPKLPVFKVFQMLKELLIKNCVQYVRIEGNTRRYKYLGRALNLSCLKDMTVNDRNVFYFKLY